MEETKPEQKDLRAPSARPLAQRPTLDETATWERCPVCRHMALFADFTSRDTHICAERGCKCPTKKRSPAIRRLINQHKIKTWGPLLAAAADLLEALDESIGGTDLQRRDIGNSRLALNHAHSDGEECEMDRLCPVGLLRVALRNAEGQRWRKQ